MNDTAGSIAAEKRARKFEGKLRRSGQWGIATAVAAAAIFAGSVGSDLEANLEIFGVAIIVASAAAAIGGLLGFLFGIPRTLQSDAPSNDGSTRYLGNTNLEQISDWLTKIIVGLSLVQLGRALPALGRLGNSLSPMLGAAPGSSGFGLSLCIYSSVVSFVVVYLWTRVDLRREMMIADSSISNTVLKEVKATVAPVVQNTVNEAVRESVDAAVRSSEQAAQRTAEMVVDAQSQRDALVLQLVDRQLTDHNPPTQDELNEAFGTASRLALTQAYQRAQSQRDSNWRSKQPDDQAAMERTIPIFRSLISRDAEERFHRHFAELGFALKDATVPDLEGAREMFSKAIEVRDAHGVDNFSIYEWGRAAVAIMNDAEFRAGRPTEGGLRAAILADLRAAKNDLGDAMFSMSDPGEPDQSRDAIATWLRLNDLSIGDL
jgi:hypothetical protein